MNQPHNDDLAPFRSFLSTLDAVQARLATVPNVVLPNGNLVTRAEADALGYTTENTTEVKPGRFF